MKRKRYKSALRRVSEFAARSRRKTKNVADMTKQARTCRETIEADPLQRKSQSSSVTSTNSLIVKVQDLKKQNRLLRNKQQHDAMTSFEQVHAGIVRYTSAVRRVRLATQRALAAMGLQPISGGNEKHEQRHPARDAKESQSRGQAGCPTRYSRSQRERLHY